MKAKSSIVLLISLFICIICCGQSTTIKLFTEMGENFRVLVDGQYIEEQGLNTYHLIKTDTLYGDQISVTVKFEEVSNANPIINFHIPIKQNGRTVKFQKYSINRTTKTDNYSLQAVGDAYYWESNIQLPQTNYENRLNFFDDFSSSSRQWNLSECEIRDGKVIISNKANDYFDATGGATKQFNLDLSKDFTLEMKMQWLSKDTNSLCIILMACDTLKGTGNAAFIKNSGFYSCISGNLEDTEPTMNFNMPKVKSMQPAGLLNVVKIVKESYYFSLYINDVFITKTPFDPYGLMFAIGGDNLEFDDFKLNGFTY